MFKYIIFFLFFALINGVVLAQSEKMDEQETKPKMDSLSTSKAKQIDSLQFNFTQRLDTLQALSTKLNQLSDTLSPDLSRYNNVLDSVRGKLSQRIDSLNKLQLPTVRYTRLLDSLNQISPAKTLNQAKGHVANVQNKVNSLEGKVNNPANKVEGKINEKLSLMKSEGGEGANLPGNINLPGVDAPGVPGIEGSLPSSDLNLTEGQPGLPSGQGKGQLGGLPNINEGIPALDELNKAQEGLGEVKSISGKVAGYGEDVKNITSGNIDEVKQLPETLESEATRIGDTGILQERTQELDGMKELAAQGNDKEALKKQAIQLAPKLASNHFKGQEAALQQAIEKVTSLKGKYTELTNLEDLPKRRPNAMKGKPFIERVVPGITLQIQRSDNVWLDYSVGAGYRISGRFTAGLSWNERIGITRHFGFTSNDRIYGPRTFVDFKIKKGFSVRADVEKMYAYIPPNPLNTNPPSDLGNHQWVWSAFVGIKKDYDFMKSVKGNFQMLYNIYDDHDNSPYTNRINVRFGFDFPLRKKPQ